MSVGGIGTAAATPSELAALLFACIATRSRTSLSERTTCCSSEDIPVPRTHNNQAVSGCLALNARATALRTEESFHPVALTCTQADDRPGGAPVCVALPGGFHEQKTKGNSVVPTWRYYLVHRSEGSVPRQRQREQLK